MDESKVVKTMIALYCRKHHKQQGGGLCSHCQGLYQYVEKRSGHCPRKAVKTFCASCPIKCYGRAEREEMRRIMKFSGPRMLFYHPAIAISHLFDTVRHQFAKHRNTR